MKWMLAVAAIMLSGCTVRAYGDASMLKGLDRPNEKYTVTNETAPTVKPTK
jgi:hypothetical protein